MRKAVRDMEIGEELPSYTYEVSLEKMKAYSRYNLQGRDAKNIHTDDETARKAGLPKAVAQTRYVLAATICESMLDIFGEGWIRGGKISVVFPRPIFAGDVLTFGGKVKDRVPEGPYMRVVFDVWLEKENGEKVISGEASGLIYAKKRAFDFYHGYELGNKPRRTGLLIVSDRAVPLALQRAYLEDHSEIIDMAKFVDHGGLLARYSEAWLRNKIALYKQYGIDLFVGGVPFEIAVTQNKVKEYFHKVKELGFIGAEISDDIIPPMSNEQRISFIKLACEVGLKPFTEVGRKFPDKPIDVDETVKIIQSDLELGVAGVTIEISEIANLVREGTDKLLQIVERVGLDKLIFEVGGGGQLNFEVLGWLFRTLGPEVNIENVELEQCVEATAARLRLSRLTGYKLVTK